MKISFDFDGCLGSLKGVQKYAKELIERGIEVWVVTTRYDDAKRNELFGDYTPNEDLWEAVEDLGIPVERVAFTNFEWKVSFFKDHTEFLWHLDDNPDELVEARKLKSPKMLLVTGSWRNKCEKLIASCAAEK